MFADDGGLHDALAVDDAAQTAGPGGVDQRVGDGATVEGGDVAALYAAVIGDDDRDGCVELAEAAQHPVLARGLVVALDVHGREELFGDLDLALAVLALISAVAAELAGFGDTCKIALGVALADAVEGLAGDDMEVPGLGVERGRGAHGELDHLADQRLGHGLAGEAARAAPTAHDVVVVHDACLPLVSDTYVETRAGTQQAIRRGWLLSRRCGAHGVLRGGCLCGSGLGLHRAWSDDTGRIGRFQRESLEAF